MEHTEICFFCVQLTQAHVIQWIQNLLYNIPNFKGGQSWRLSSSWAGSQHLFQPHMASIHVNTCFSVAVGHPSQVRQQLQGSQIFIST